MRGIGLLCLVILWAMNIWGHVHGHIPPWAAYSTTAILAIASFFVWRRAK